MIIYGSTPDALAHQQNLYDQLYGSANQANANALTQANMEQLRMAMQNREQQARQSEQQNQMNWQANQAALDRQQRGSDVAMQYAGATRLDLAKQNEQEFNNAAKDANNGALPADPKKLKVLYPHFNDSQINQLYQLAGSASVSRVQYSANNADKIGQPPDPSLIDVAGVPKGTEFEKQAQQIVASLRTPYEQQYTQGQQLADTGSRLARISVDEQGIKDNPVPTSSGVVGDLWDSAKSILWPFRSTSSVPSQDVLKPNPDAQARLATEQQNFATALAQKQPLVQMSGAGYAPTAPASWRPQSSAMPPTVATTSASPAPFVSSSAMPSTAPVAQPAVKPLPMKNGMADRTQMVAGQIYQTIQGPALWTGTGFKKIQSSSP